MIISNNEGDVSPSFDMTFRQHLLSRHFDDRREEKSPCVMIISNNEGDVSPSFDMTFQNSTQDTRPCPTTIS